MFIRCEESDFLLYMVFLKITMFTILEIFGILAQAMNVMFLFLEVTGVYKFKCVVYSTVLFFFKFG